MANKSCTQSNGKQNAQLRNDLVRAALRWYANWKKATSGEGPDASDGWQSEDIRLYGACRRYKRDL